MLEKGDSRPDGIHDAGRTCNDKRHYVKSADIFVFIFNKF